MYCLEKNLPISLVGWPILLFRHYNPGSIPRLSTSHCFLSDYRGHCSLKNLIAPRLLRDNNNIPALMDFNHIIHLSFCLFTWYCLFFPAWVFFAAENPHCQYRFFVTFFLDAVVIHLLPGTFDFIAEPGSPPPVFVLVVILFLFFSHRLHGKVERKAQSSVQYLTPVSNKRKQGNNIKHCL